jgi:type III restriction enzyme
LILQPVQGSQELSAKVDVARIVDAYTSNLVKHAIEIPEIVVLPSRKDVTFGFKDFDLEGLDSLGVRPMDGKILIRNIRTGDFYDPIEVNAVSAKEPQLENYIVRCLVDHDEVDYDQHAALLFKLAHQVVEHLKSYLDGPQVEAVLRVHATMLADLVFAQMMEHYWETPTTYVPTVSKGFIRLGEHHFGKERSLLMRDVREAVTPRGDTRKYLFNGFSKCALDAQRFHSDDERRLALLIDQRAPEVKVWLKPGSGVFQISYARGNKYEPDFLVETATEMLICEVKAANELADLIVQSKATAARTWIGAANAVAKDTGRKPWRYALIPHDAVTETATLAGLIRAIQRIRPVTTAMAWARSSRKFSRASRTDRPRARIRNRPRLRIEASARPPTRTRQRSSSMDTSRTWCSRFSMPQWARTSASSRSGPALATGRLVTK